MKLIRTIPISTIIRILGYFRPTLISIIITGYFRSSDNAKRR